MRWQDLLTPVIGLLAGKRNKFSEGIAFRADFWSLDERSSLTESGLAVRRPINRFWQAR